MKWYEMRFYIDDFIKKTYIYSRYQARLFLCSLENPEIAIRVRQTDRNLRNVNLKLCIIPNANLVYLPIEKAATSTIKRLLDEIGGNKRFFKNKNTKSFYGNPPDLNELMPADVYRVLSSKDSLNFTFVRNPYERLLSAWIDKFKDRHLVASPLFQRPTPEMDLYLELIKNIDIDLPSGRFKTLGFNDFLIYARETRKLGLDNHLRSQVDIIKDSDISLNLIGKTENFAADFKKIADYANAEESVKSKLIVKIHKSKSYDKNQLLTSDCKALIAEIYREDFLAFNYEF
jgi:hypothetical protein